MTTTTFEGQQSDRSLTTVAAWSMIAGALLLMIGGFVFARLSTQEPPPAALIALRVVSDLLLAAGVAGLVRSGVAGRGRLATIGLVLTVLGFLVLCVAEIALAMESDIDMVLFGIASAVLVVGLIMIGVAVLRARRWTGWQRFLPLVLGLYLLPIGPLPGIAFSIALGVWGILWLLFGLTMRAEASGERPTPAR